MPCPELWIVAGPNGAGKTTCVQREPISVLLPNVPFLNPDARTLVKLLALGYQGFHDAPLDAQTHLFFESANEVYFELENAVSANLAVGVETILSSDKYCPLVKAVRKKNGFVRLIYIALSSPSIAKERVAARVREGGHGIPAEKIEQRWHRSLDRLAWFTTQATAFWIIDNSDSNPANPPLLVATGKLGMLESLDETVFPELKVALSSLGRK